MQREEVWSDFVAVAVAPKLFYFAIIPFTANCGIAGREHISQTECNGEALL